MLILDALVSGLKDVCAGVSGKRKGGDAVYSMADIGLAAFSLFFLPSESFLAHQRELEEARKTSNCRTLFGIAKIPTNNRIRSNSTRLRRRFCNPRSIGRSPCRAPAAG